MRALTFLRSRQMDLALRYPAVGIASYEVLHTGIGGIPVETLSYKVRNEVLSPGGEFTRSILRYHRSDRRMKSQSCDVVARWLAARCLLRSIGPLIVGLLFSPRSP